MAGETAYTSDSKHSISYTDADGVKYTNQTDINFSAEAIEGESIVSISGGTTIIKSTDDGLNCSDTGGTISISGGELYINALKGDGIDSNGYVTISGGTVVTIATTGSEDGLDSGDNYYMSVTGGLVAALSGASNFDAEKCTQVCLGLGSSYTGSSGTNFAVKDSSGNVVYALTIPTDALSFGSLILTSPKLSNGSTYNVYSGCTFTGGENFNGLYTTLPTVTGGTSKGTITSSNYVGTLGINSNPGAGGGNAPGQPGGRN